MPRGSRPRVIVLSAIGIILVANAVLFGGRIFGWASDLGATTISAVAGRISWVRSIVASVAGRADLAGLVRNLEAENAQLRAQTAVLDDVRRESELYRTAAGITARPSGPALEAGIFSYLSVSGVRQAILNRGTEDGVSAGDVVITARGELVGIIQSADGERAVVRRLQDISSEVTARISGLAVSGLVRSVGDGSLLLDLVQKDEAVQEGALVITSGDDRYPSGLVIGTVRSVDNTATTLFKIVRIAPAVSAAVHGFVLVIRP